MARQQVDIKNEWVTRVKEKMCTMIVLPDKAWCWALQVSDGGEIIIIKNPGRLASNLKPQTGNIKQICLGRRNSDIDVLSQFTIQITVEKPYGFWLKALERFQEYPCNHLIIVIKQCHICCFWVLIFCCPTLSMCLHFHSVSSTSNPMFWHDLAGRSAIIAKW